ncbi:hypothetical protein [Pseudoalteromonas sp. TB64]|uniref:hypothetical protein n=1 Tax=Pseudoalteromonas sp. TB64 TaxID=1938600 RepID=UPI0005190AE9|nr:hypothetical protein [Pseudoalteromonas sp. TB64]
MRNTLIRLAKIHYDIGLIDYDELNERIGVALWLAEELDDPNLDPSLVKNRPLMSLKSQIVIIQKNL